MKLWLDEITTPIGPLTLIVNPASGGICTLEFTTDREMLRERLAARFGPVSFADEPDPGGTANRIRAYFAGDVHAVDKLPVDTAGTPFQERVWAALRGVPPGQPVSYGQLARAIGRPGAARAVGLANGRNPVAVVIPCHRVIGADGTLTGYGGGLPRKRWLLEHEARGAAAAFALRAG